MTFRGYADPRVLFATALPPEWKPTVIRSTFGDVAVILFLLAQCLDGVFTYVGVTTYGNGVEANPVIATLMVHFGQGTALVGAKSVASLLGIALHLCRSHVAVAVLAAFYIGAAVLPWMTILFR